jgi:MFS family permease
MARVGEGVVPRAVDAGKVLVPLGLGTALSLLGDATLYTVLPTHTADAGVALGTVGVLLGVNRAVRLFLNGPAGLAYDRWPRRRLFVPALFLGALSTAIYAATRGFWPLFIGRILWGLSWSGIWVGGATMILDVAAPEARGRWTGLYQTWFFVGTTLGTLGGGVLTDIVGYSGTMWICAAGTALGGVVALFRLPETLGLQAAASGRQGEGAPVSRAEAPPLRLNRRGLRAHRAFWLAVSVQGINRFIVSGVLSATLGLLVQEWVVSTSVAIGVATLTGVMMAGRTVLSMVAAPLSGTVSDRIGSRWGVTAWGLAIGAVGMVLLAWDLPLAILAGMLAVAVSGGSLQSLTTTLTGDLVAHSQRGRAIGLLHTAGDLGSAIGPSVAYLLLPWLGLRTVYLLCGVLFVVGLIPVLRLSSEG